MTATTATRASIGKVEDEARPAVALLLLFIGVLAGGDGAAV
jgi:hypothetical protein